MGEVEVVSNAWTELGAIGFMIVGLVVFAIYMFKMIVKIMKDEQKKNDDLTKEYLDYVKKEAVENRAVIKMNAEINKKLIESLFGLENTILQSMKSREDLTKLLTRWMEKGK